MHATLKMVGGAALVWGVARFVPEQQPILAGWVGMIGLAFLLHFGAFHVLALLWQSAGVDAPHIFRSPARATSLGDLWGSRWNLAFRELAYSLVYRPLVGRLGVAGASFAAFAASGFVHELVISLPARAGYGLPTVYFLVQWLGVLAERSRLGRRLRLRRGFRGWLFALVVAAGPMGLLFHPPFVSGVMVPFLQAVRAI
jgi:alginate O-acetyltransferase complex protein AlgI